MTVQFLLEQTQLANAATEGPWLADEGVFGYDVSPTPYVTPERGLRNICQVYSDAGSADAAFIASARTAVPMLIAALEGVLAIQNRPDDTGFNEALAEVRRVVETQLNTADTCR